MKSVFISQDVVEERLLNGVKNVKYAVHVNSVSFYQNGEETVCNLDFAVKMVEGAKKVKSEDIINQISEKVAVKSYNNHVQIDLSTIELPALAEANASQMQTTLFDFYLQNYLFNNSVYGITKWVKND